MNEHKSLTDTAAKTLKSMGSVSERLKYLGVYLSGLRADAAFQELVMEAVGYIAELEAAAPQSERRVGDRRRGKERCDIGPGDGPLFQYPGGGAWHSERRKPERRQSQPPASVEEVTERRLHELATPWVRDFERFASPSAGKTITDIELHARRNMVKAMRVATTEAGATSRAQLENLRSIHADTEAENAELLKVLDELASYCAPDCGGHTWRTLPDYPGVAPFDHFLRTALKVRAALKGD